MVFRKKVKEPEPEEEEVEHVSDEEQPEPINPGSRLPSIQPPKPADPRNEAFKQIANWLRGEANRMIEAAAWADSMVQ